MYMKLPTIFKRKKNQGDSIMNRELIDLTNIPGDYSGVRFEWDSFNFRNSIDGKWYRFDIDLGSVDVNKAREVMGLIVKYLEIE